MRRGILILPQYRFWRPPNPLFYISSAGEVAFLVKRTVQSPSIRLRKRQKNIKQVQSKLLLTAKVYLSAVKNQKTLFFCLSPMSLLLGVIQRSNKIIMDDKQPIFGRQSVSLPNFFVAENIVHYLPNFVATWNPPFNGRFHGTTKQRKMCR